MAKAAGWGVMTSHRSGETEDSFIADLAVGLKTGQIKTGAPCRSERLSKYNQVRAQRSRPGALSLPEPTSGRAPSCVRLAEACLLCVCVHSCCASRRTSARARSTQATNSACRRSRAAATVERPRSSEVARCVLHAAATAVEALFMSDERRVAGPSAEVSESRTPRVPSAVRLLVLRLGPRPVADTTKARRRTCTTHLTRTPH